MFYLIVVLIVVNYVILYHFGISNFLEEISSLSHSVVFLYFFALLKKAFLSLFAILGTLHSDAYIFPFLLCFSFLFFSQLFLGPPRTAILLFLHFFSMGMVLISVSCTMSLTSFHSSSGTLSIRSRPLNLFLTSTI